MRLHRFLTGDDIQFCAGILKEIKAEVNPLVMRDNIRKPNTNCNSGLKIDVLYMFSCLMAKEMGQIISMSSINFVQGFFTLNPEQIHFDLTIK